MILRSSVAQSRAAYDRCTAKLKEDAIKELQNGTGDGDPFPEIKKICGTPPREN
jgi:hypothetical protein